MGNLVSMWKWDINNIGICKFISYFLKVEGVWGFFYEV